MVRYGSGIRGLSRDASAVHGMIWKTLPQARMAPIQTDASPMPNLDLQANAGVWWDGRQTSITHNKLNHQIGRQPRATQNVAPMAERHTVYEGARLIEVQDFLIGTA